LNQHADNSQLVWEINSKKFFTKIQSLVLEK